MTTAVRQCHFTVDPAFVMGLCRQAYWMENRKEWALATLHCFHGLSETQIDAILSGTASVVQNPKNPDLGLYVDSPDTEWQKTLAEHKAWQESRTYLFGDRRVPRDQVDHYVNNIVKRLRDTMRLGGLGMLAMDPLQLMDLERQREEEHEAIFVMAGFSPAEIALRTEPTKWSPEFAAFNDALQAHIDKQTDWMQPTDREPGKPGHGYIRG